jgi:hypothetical protein
MIANICKKFIARHQDINVCHLYETHEKNKKNKKNCGICGPKYLKMQRFACCIICVFIIFKTLIWLWYLMWGLYKWREEIITYEYISCSLSIKTLPPLGLVAIHLTWLGLDKFVVFEADFRVESTRNNNIWVAHYFMTICWMNGRYSHMQ